MSGLYAGVLHRQRQPRLIAENGLVLGAVVLEHPVHVLLLGAEEQVHNKYEYLDDALDEVVEQGALGFEQPRHKRRQEHEQPQAQRQRKHQRHRHDDPLQLFRRHVLFQPLVEFRGLGRLVLGEIVRREHQRLDALDHGVQKRHHAPNNGQPQHGVLIPHQLQLLHLGHQPLRRAHHDGLLLRPAHEDALNERLPADGRAEGLFFFFYSHEFTILSASPPVYHISAENATNVLFFILPRGRWASVWSPRCRRPRRCRCRTCRCAA